MASTKVYHVVVEINDTYGKLRFALYFPSAQMRKQFCLTHRAICAHVGRRPLIATPSDLNRTRCNIAYYVELRDFLAIWDEAIK